MNNQRDEIYNSITKKQIWTLFAAGGFIGAVIFVICYGFTPLNVTNEAWLTQGGDLMQHYVGWKAYRNSSWHFPIGLTEGLYDPYTTCVIFTDSIPLFAIFFKLLSPILPTTFQYFGLWGFMSFILMGGISAIIIRKGTKNLWVCVAGSIFFSYSPYVFHRLYVHTALAANWLILLAIAIWVYKPYFCNFKRKTIAWGTLLIVGSLIHIYYIPMIMIFMFFSCLEDLLKNKGWKLDLLMAPIVIAVDLLVLYVVGAFSSTTSMESEGLGEFSANLNTFWNPFQYSRFLGPSPTGPNQSEGLGYLGLGMLLLSVISLCFFVIRKIRSRKVEKDKTQKFWVRNAFYISMIMAFVCIMLLAISPTITYGMNTLLEIPYPDKILELLSIFRASGRFIWCAGYIIMFVVIMELARYLEPIIVGTILMGTLMIQLVDLTPLVTQKGMLTQISDEKEIFSTDQWEAVSEGKSRIIFIPHTVIWVQKDIDMIYEFSNFALDHHMTTSFFMSARIDLDRMSADDAARIQQMAEGNIDKDAVYILDNQVMGQNLGLDTQVIDGLVVGTKE